MYSQQHTLKYGVQQGSVLGARMYTMYTEPMRTIIEKHNISYHSYADNTQLYIHCGNNELSIKADIKQLEHCKADNNNNNNNNKVYTPLSEKCSQSRVFISQCHIIHIVQYYAYWRVRFM